MFLYVSGFASPRCVSSFAREAERKSEMMNANHRNRRSNKLSVGCWNMRTLVEADGSIGVQESDS